MDPESLTRALGSAYLWIIGGGYVIALLAETIVPLEPLGSEVERTRHVVRNLSLAVVTRFVTSAALGLMLLALDNKLLATGWGLLDVAELPLALLVVTGVLAVDFGQYIFHRAAHRIRWIWLLHAVHHSDARLDVSTGLRFHPGETVLNLIWTSSFLWVLGLPLWLMAPQRLLMIPVALLQPAKSRQPASLDRGMRHAIVTQGLHQIHHSPVAVENNSNFGEVFSFWDRMFGTLRESSEVKPQKYGLETLNGERWQTLWGMLATPFWARRIPSL